MTQTRLPLVFPKHPTACETLRKAEPVSGPHSITAKLNRLDDILAWQEGRCQFDHGYYRFVDNPILSRLQKGLQTHFQLRHCLVYTSWKSAALELLNYLLLSKPKMTLKIVSDWEAGAAGSLSDSLSGLNTLLIFSTPNNLSALLPFSQNKDELLVINVKHPFPFLENQATFLQTAKSQRLPIIFVSDQIPEKTWSPQKLMYWVFPLSLQNADILGGAILSNMDRQMAELKALRRQRGPVLSSRNAAYFLGEETVKVKSHKEQLVQYFCEWEQAEYGFLFPSGMQAITTLLNLVRCPEKPQITAIGHLYADTYALLTDAKQRTGSPENRFLGVDEMAQFPQAINAQTAAIITETITNPLNDVPDLETILAVAHNQNTVVIVDNTFATPLNCNPLHLGADFVLHSTTKYFNGKNDHAGGVIVLNDAVAATKIQKYQEQWGNEISPLEAAVLWERLQDFEERMERFQKNVLRVAEFLKDHPHVETIYFHRFPSHRSFNVSQRLLKGPGSVLSFTLKKPGLKGLREFYDSSLPHILKAPSLGSNQTILCPYTLLAHYHESDEALEKIGLPRYLIRLSVGCEEEIQPVIDSLDAALQ